MYIYVYICMYTYMFSEYIRTFFEQLSIFDCNSLKALVACSKERKIVVIKRAKIKTSFSLSSRNLAISRE